MKIPESEATRPLKFRCDDLAEAWYNAIALMGSSRFGPVEMRQRLGVLAKEVFQIILADSFDPNRAREVGASLVQLDYTQPEVMSQTLEVFSQQLAFSLNPDQLIQLHPRLTTLAGELVAGFLIKVQEKILAEQERIYAAVEVARQQAESARQESEHRNQAIIQAIPDSVTIVDLQGQIQYYHSSRAGRLSRVPNDYLGKNINELVPPRVVDTFFDRQRKAQQHNRMEVFEFSLTLSQGINTYEARIVPYTEDQVLIINRDVTDLKRAEASLHETNALLQQLTQQLIAAQENERLAIARDLHDGVLNQLATLLVKSENNLTPADGQQEYQTLVDYLRQTINMLRPPLLNYGLLPALRELCDDLTDYHGEEVPLLLDIPPSEVRFDDKVEAQLFRIVQQACENALHHAHAHRISITGSIDTCGVTIRIEDDGIGFDFGEQLNLTEVLARKHFGIAGMMERGTLIGAQVQVRSSPGDGTQVNVTWKADRA
jgi:signal transduction histidine kinase